MWLVNNKKSRITICLLTYLCMANSAFSVANSFTKEDDKLATEAALATTVQKAIFNIDARLLALLELSASSAEEAEQALLVNKYSDAPLNVGEQYLLLLTQAKIKQHVEQHKEAVVLLEQASLLSQYIAEQQLALPVFNQLYLALTQSLVAIGDYKKAYQAKHTYIHYFNQYSDIKHSQTLDLLTEKHEISHKVKENELLNHKNKLAALQLSQIEKQQGYQKRNLVLVAGALFIFMLFFVRQLKQRKKLLLLSKTDSLTGLLNRSALFERGQALVKHTTEQRSELSLLLFDIDHFKRVNDDYGHNVGDIVLMEVAKLVNETLRARDIFARLGGEEFVILLPDTDIDKAKAIAVRVIEKIAQYDFNYLGIKRGITLSIGVANVKDCSPIFDDILHAADLAMYQAKLQGRNQMINYACIAQDQERRSHTYSDQCN